MSDIHSNVEVPIKEGKVIINVKPTGKERGPGVRGGVFYNPAMVNNRDLSIVIVDTLLDRNMLPGRTISILDGLCGSGIRAFRFAGELNDVEGVVIRGTDLDERSISKARECCTANNLTVDLRREELNRHLLENRYSYVDVDPFGSPAPFMRNAVSSLLNGGVLAVTATDTAALTGSLPRVAMRRYDSNVCRTSFKHELACRVLLGSLARTAASQERAVSPLLFYSVDHFVRGYVRLGRGAGRTDTALGNVGYLLVDGNGSVEVTHELGEIARFDGHKKVIGPVWTGDLENKKIVSGMLESLKGGSFSYMKSRDRMVSLLELAVSESGSPPGGYDTNAVASQLGMSPPGMSKLIDILLDRGYLASRSRFSPVLVKTDASWIGFKRAFIDAGRGD